MAPVITLIHIASNKHPQSMLQPSYVRNFILLQLVSAMMLLVHLVNMALWTGLYWLCGDFAEFETAYYH